MSFEDIEGLRAGSHFLASGGGLEFEISKLMLKNQLSARLPEIVELGSLKSDDLVVLISYMGCPVIEAEKNFNLSHLDKLIKKIESVFQKKIDVFSMWGVAGGGCFLPLFLSSLFDISIVDADSTGRNFPELQMLSTNLAGIPPRKAFISNVMGHVFEIGCDNFQALERHARRITVSSGGACMIIPQVLTGEEAKRGLISGSLTKAMTIGKIIQETRDLNAVMEYVQGTFVGVGGVVSTTGMGLPKPFKRRVILRNTETRKVWELLMENEYSILLENGKVIAEVPDIIVLCDPYSCEPLTAKDFKKGANVAICTMKAPDVWYTEKGLALIQTEAYRHGRAAASVIPSLELLERIA